MFFVRGRLGKFVVVTRGGYRWYNWHSHVWTWGGKWGPAGGNSQQACGGGKKKESDTKRGRESVREKE